MARSVSEVTTYLCIRDAAKAIDFYVNAFGARETFKRITDSTGASATPRSRSAPPPSCWPTSIRSTAS
jgi:uncharacterized glyoxalase superfamily protein PhnB